MYVYRNNHKNRPALECKQDDVILIYIYFRKKNWVYAIITDSVGVKVLGFKHPVEARFIPDQVINKIFPEVVCLASWTETVEYIREHIAPGKYVLPSI